MDSRTSHRSKIETVYRFFSGTGVSYDTVVSACTLGFDGCWKRKIISRIPVDSARIIDQACGTGILTFDIARAFPSGRVVGVELRDEYLDIARRKAETLGIKNVDFVLGRAEDVVLEGGYDCIVSSYLAKYAELDVLIANAGSMLRPGGVIIMHDFTYPSNKPFLLLWRTYMRALKMIGPRFFPEWRTVFDELPEFLRQTEWVPDSLAELKKNAFCSIASDSLTSGSSAIVTAVKL